MEQYHETAGNTPRLALRLREFADSCGVSERTVWSWARLDDDPLPAATIRGTVLIPVDTAREWLARRAQKNKGPHER